MVLLAAMLAWMSVGCARVPAASAPAACPPSSGGPGSGLQGRFSEGGLVFDYPAAWHEFHYQNVSTMSSVIAYLATVDVHDPCVRSANGMSCGPGYELQPGTMVVTVETAAFPGFNILDVPAGAQPLVAGGLPGYVQDSDPFAQTGATAARTWSLAMPGSIDNYYRITAQAREPGVDAAFAQVDSLVAGLAVRPARHAPADGRGCSRSRRAHRADRPAGRRPHAGRASRHRAAARSG